MLKLEKTKAFFRRKKTSPEYTRRQWFMKCIQIFLGVIIIDQAGLKLFNYDYLYQEKQISYAQAYGFNYLFFALIQGVFMGLTVWRLFEIYWWAKDHAAI